MGYFKACSYYDGSIEPSKWYLTVGGRQQRHLVNPHRGHAAKYRPMDTGTWRSGSRWAEEDVSNYELRELG